ncbi:TRAP transporter small permease [Aliamphritea spongicola]|uniref:TRAP transporter small permease n=1 Tax=Aliamphritea spongicola TaxID=707589 RepID=UPI00196BB1B8|nr:TRAP transporter small permease [Aliamphritea spongicola]MBN3562731.1 TRAP transporter small permease [Aliamphritea spongicola]
MQTPEILSSGNETLATQPAGPQSSSLLKKCLVRFEALLNHIFRTLMLFAGLMLAVLMFAQVIMRYVLESPFTGIEEASILLAVWVYFLGMGYATRQHDHIHGGILSLVVKDPYKTQLFRLFGSLICMLAACVFGYFACKYALKEIDRGRLSINLRWPRGIWSASMIVGFAMMVGYFLLNAIGQIRQLRTMKTTCQESQQ